MSADLTEDEFRAMIRERSAEPQVRALMPVLHWLYDGDGYTEDEDGFSWLVIDASRIVDFVEADRALNLPRGYCDDPRASILNAMEDSGRWASDDPEPTYALGVIEAALSPAEVQEQGDGNA